MATALTPSSNTKHWWPRISASRENSFLPESSHLFSDIPATIGRRPHTSSGATRPSWMTSVTNSSSTSSNAFTATSKSSRFNLAAVIGFGSKSKRQQPVDIQDPPSQIRSLPGQNPDTHIDFGVASHLTSSSSRRLSRALVSTESGTSAASTDVPLTPADDPSSFGARTSYQHSARALTDLSDPFAANSPLSERRSSTHSDKSLSKRLMQKIDGKTTKTTMRLPLGDGPKKESRDRSSTLPSRARTSKDASDAYQALRAVEPPWAESAPLDPPSTTSASPSATIRQSKASKPGLPWSHTQATRGGHKPQTHQRTQSSSSISNENLTESSPRTRTARPSTSSSTTTTSPSSSTFTSQFSSNSYSSGHAAGHLVDTLPLAMPLPSTAPAPLPGSSTPLTPSSRTKPRPPPTSGLPPTPTPPQSSLPPHVRSPTPPSAEQHPLRSRSGTVASTSAVSFASSLSSLSFNSRPSPQEPPSVGAYDYPSLLNETLPVPGSEDPIPRRNSNSGSSSHSYNDGKDLSGPTSNPVQTDPKPKPSKSALLVSRPLPSSPASSVSQAPNPKRERVASAASLTSEAGKTVRRQRSFHNTSLHAPTPMQPTLRHYNSFDPAPPGSGAQTRSPPLPPFRSPPLAPTQDLPPLPPSASNLSKRGSTGKDSITSPRRRLFGANRHDRDRDRERKQELDSVDTSVAPSFSSAGQASASSSAQIQSSSSSSSSWFDDRSAGSEPASASSTSTSTAQDVAQHIVPPAELLRLGAQWERENESRGGLRRAKSSWGGHRDLDGGRALLASSSKIALSRSSGNGSSNTMPAPSTGSRLPRSTSLLSKASSAPSFNSSHGTHAITSGASSSAVPVDLYTSLSPPPPRRQQRSIVRGLPAQGSTALPPPPPRRTPSTTTTASSGSPPPKGALIERKPSFLDMTSTRQSVTLDVSHLAGRDERDSFLELSREMGSIDTIRESISSVDSFME